MARMESNPFELPRTRIGLGGGRLIDMPGVKHSESVLKAGRGMQTVCYFNVVDLKRLAAYLRL